ncbi:MAG: cupin domain-containing protein [Chitinophagaceae bacterium]|nr:MAG: cupin domain-containing protein [Chitinophagaceae bacterium]
MKRNSFMKLLLAAGSVALVPMRTLANGFRFNRDAKGYKVDAGKDRLDQPLSLMESYHVHATQDEWWYVMTGEFLFRVGGKDFTAKPGDFVFGPRGVPHAFCKVGEGEAKLMMGFQPAGKMEAFFKLSAQGVLKDMTEEQREALRQEHGFTRVGPPIKNLKI